MFKEENIRKLLKLYGADDKEIENFINDLKNMPIDQPSDEFDPDDEESDYELTD